MSVSIPLKAPPTDATFGFGGLAVVCLQYPTEIRGSVHQTLSTDAPANERFSAQASKDWDTYLKHRTTELRKGGQVRARTHAPL